jgi:hypothetical protein
VASRKKTRARTRRTSLWATTAAVVCLIGPASALANLSANLGTMSSGRSLRVSGENFTPHAAVVVAQCSPNALKAALKAVSMALDDCDEHFVGVTSTRADGSFTVRARAEPTIQTASGEVDCRKVSCLLGAVNLSSLQGAPLQVAISPLSFSKSASSAPAPRPAKQLLSETYGSPPLTPGRPARTEVIAYPAGSLGPGRIGQVTSVPARPLPRRPLRGEGLLSLTMSAPQTSWSSPVDTSVVVQARVDHGSWQQIVLFAGAKPFTYEGFTGPLRSGRHVVEVRIRRDLSHVGDHSPLAVIVNQSLRVVTARSTSGLELAHAPVLYDRRVSTTQDTPLITYGTNVPEPAGARRLTYVVTWSHEDAGTGFVPWLEWGTWGRMTDIETAITFTVDRRGRPGQATYLTCVTCGRHFPENRTALDETEAPFRGSWFHGHPVLRVATGNNDFSDVGTTAMRFQQALAAPPLPGDTREGAMDRNPWTYSVMGSELVRNRADYSTSAGSAGPGDPRQYLIVQLDATARQAAAVGVDIRFAGSAQVYSNDLGTTYPLYDGGQGRTVVKVPMAVVSHPITMLRLRLLGRTGSASAPSVVVHRLRVLQYINGTIVSRTTPGTQIVTEPTPPPATGAPPAITVS